MKKVLVGICAMYMLVFPGLAENIVERGQWQWLILFIISGVYVAKTANGKCEEE